MGRTIQETMEQEKTRLERIRRTRNKRQRRITLKQALVMLAVVVISVFALLPFYQMIIMGTYYTDQLYTGVKLLPGHYLMHNLRNILKHDFFLFYANSLIVAISNTVIGVAISTLAGYGFAKYHFKGEKVSRVESERGSGLAEIYGSATFGNHNWGLLCGKKGIRWQ